MPNRPAPYRETLLQADRQLLDIARELRVARITSGLRQRDVARAVGVSTAAICRLERGNARSVPIARLVVHASAVGLRLWVRAYPAGRRLLDTAQLDLFARLRAESASIWGWRTEAALPLAGDLRAIDVVGRVPGCVLAVELITRLADFQAQSRAALLKKRDLPADRLLLVVAATRANRRALAEVGAAVAGTFPVATRAALGALRAGRDPGGDGIVLL